MSTLLGDYDALKFGALLQDIGKFLEYAGITETDKIDCGRVRYSHPKIGSNFLKLLNLEPAIIDLVLYHHDPNVVKDRNNSYLCKIIQLSDWLSSGERKETEEEIKTTREYPHLVSIFNEVVIEKQIEVSYEDALKYKMAPLNFDDADTIFPEKEIKGKYKDILSDFRKDITTELNGKKDINRLLFLLQKYWWCVPSATWWQGGKYIPDVSLFDHSKTTCAIASCLYKQGITEKELDELIAKKEGAWKEQKLFCLIHGDLSGIQNFIYTIKTKSAAKSLKGRSLMVVLLQRFIAEHILKKLDLPLSNLIYSGGGHFYILAPKNLCEQDFIKEMRKEINKNLKTYTKLYLTLGHVDICPEDFIKENFAKKWKAAAEETSKQKMRKYEEFECDEIFKPFDEGGEKEICSICGKELKDDDAEILKDDDAEIKICKSCKQFMDISGYLKQIQDKGYFEISELNKRFEMLKSFDTIFDGKIFLNPSGGVPFFSIPMGIPIIQENDGKKIKEFKQLAEDAEKDTGTKKIAVLKMDVDNLGKIFTKGLGGNATISRVSTLSNMLSLFFEGYINNLIEKSYKKDIYLIYAGGDDTFIVGRWDKMIHFAYDVYQNFRKYTCNNPDITLSAGLVIVSPTYPLRRAAEMAENELDEAKRVEQGNHKKNSLCIFNQPLKWCIKEDKSVNDFEMVERIENILLECVRDWNAPRQLIQRVNVSSRGLKKALKNKNKEKNHGIDINDYWRLKYYFHRNYKDKDGQWKYPKIETLIDVIYEEIINRNLYSKEVNYDINLISIAARIAELKTRGEKDV
ncbi:MAG: type III-A CRISPR-associated protein Cas10/Csm1 [Candidatus Altiarchaeales archaeon A3]|nr:MAG: type III-A CRISPR-associated protein Cas10/Csm1 [Candidatus Altiarchaeales archaeon A3]